MAGAGGMQAQGGGTSFQLQNQGMQYGTLQTRDACIDGVQSPSSARGCKQCTSSTSHQAAVTRHWSPGTGHQALVTHILLA